MIITNEAHFWLVISKLKNCQEVVLDIETTGLNIWQKDRLCGVGLYFSETDEGYYLPFRHRLGNEETMPLLMGLEPPNENLPLDLLPSLWKALEKVPRIIGHNIKFDLAGLYQDGYEVPEHQEIHDTMSMARLCSQGKYPDMSLDGLIEKYYGKEDSIYKAKFQQYLKRNNWDNNYDYAPAQMVGEYCISDVKWTYKIRQAMYREIVETEQERVLAQENELLPVVWSMEQIGLYYDMQYLVSSLTKVKARIQMINEAIWDDVGYEFNPLSGKELAEAIKSLGVEATKIGKNGYASWDTAELMKISHPIAGKIIELRGLEKVKSTYFESLFEWANQVIHCHFKPWGTATGRMSGTNPNLQNLTRGVQNLMGGEMSEEVLSAFKAMMGAYQGQTVDGSKGAVSSLTTGTVKGLTEKFDDNDEMTIAVRRLYIPRPGFIMYFIDFSQMEMRVFADYVKDPELNALLESRDFDFHDHVAMTVWGVNPGDELWKFYRTLAKAVNFGLIYGIGTTKLAAQIQKSEKEAKIYKAQYFDRFPRARTFISQVDDRIKSRGYVINRFGRRYYLPEDKGYVGVNYLVQGTSADIVKNRMIACHKFLKSNKTKSRMINQVHDEIIFELHETEHIQLIPIMKEIMEERQIETYLPADVSVGLPSMAQKKDLCMLCLKPIVEDKKKGEVHICNMEMSTNQVHLNLVR